MSGGSAGKIDYPQHIKESHKDWLVGVAPPVGPSMNTTITELMNIAQTGDSPYAGYSAMNPNTVYFFSGLAATDYKHIAPYQLVDDFYDWDIDTAYAAYANAPGQDELVAAFSDNLYDEVNTKILPQFEAGMADLNATMSSAFVIGRTQVWSDTAREVSKFSAQVRSEMVFKRLSLQMEQHRLLAVLAAENSRNYLMMTYASEESNMEFLAKDVVFDMEMYQYGANVLASIAGGGMPTKTPGKPSMFQTAVAGSATGAGVGGAVAGPYGAGIGAALGAAYGVYSAQSQGASYTS